MAGRGDRAYLVAGALVGWIPPSTFGPLRGEAKDGSDPVAFCRCSNEVT